MAEDRPLDGAASGATSGEIGPYRLLEVLGEGGMGVVWLAEQNEPVRRQVALKIIKLGMDTREVVSRFETERQALAVMDHPNIARVFDAGATESGRPFFVMELVRGLPLTDYCDTKRLTAEARIRIFQDVCRAVQHAHQKGIIHRDLKPSNILVTESDDQPHPKIIDFGIARATEEAEPDGTRLTRQHHQIGTPAYMSPEQILGQNLDIDTRSDIYALGVLLYELLVGALPFADGAYTGPALLAQLAREAPTPSTRFDTLPGAAEQAQARSTNRQSLARLLRGDLDWVVLKAMAKDRDLRYETVNALRLELGRFLGKEPVLARPPSTAYRAKKFVQRHRASTAFAGVAFVLAIGFGAAQTVQAERIRRARDLAETRRVQAEGLIYFMVGDLREKLEPIGRLDILSDVGDQAMAYFAALPETELTDTELLTRSRALNQIGEVRLNEGHVEEALGPFRESHRLTEALWTRKPDNADRLFGLAQSHFWLGFPHFLVGSLDQAEAEFVEYLHAAEALVAMDGENPDYRMELAYAHGTLGTLRETQGDLPEAVEEYNATLALQKELVQKNPSNLDWQLELAETYNKLGVAQRKMGNYREALQAHQWEWELKEDLLRRDSRNAYYRFRLSTALDLMAEVQVLHGALAEAEENNRASLGIMADLVVSDPSNVEWRRAEAVGERQLAENLLRRGSLAEAREMFGRAQVKLGALGESGATTLDWRTDLGRVGAGLARMWLESGDPGKALEEVRAARALLADSGSVDGTRERAGAEVEIVAGRALRAMGRTAEAQEAWEEALRIVEPQAHDPGGGDSRVLRLEALILLRRLDEAESSLTELRASGFGEPWILAEAEALGISGQTNQ